MGVWLDNEQEQWKQKSRETWMHLGDKKNTMFFYSLVNANHSRNHIYHLITEEGEAVTNINTIKEMAPAYYKQLFNQDSYWTIFPELVVKKKLTAVAATWPSRDVSNEEIKVALHHMHPDKAPGPVGHNVYLFQKH